MATSDPQPGSGTNIKYVDFNGLSHFKEKQDGEYVKKETGKGLSTNDYTTAEKNKLASIENGATANKEYYGTCSTAAGTQIKVVDCTGFKLEEGCHIRVIFTNAQTYNGVVQLNVNSTGAINVQYKQGTNSVRYIWSAGELIDFTYNGTYWIMHERALASTTYYGVAKLVNSAISTSTSLALVPASLNSVMQYIVTGYPVYSTSATYDVGDRVRYSTYVYECITAITTAEAWTAAHWEIVDSLQTQIDNLSSNAVVDASYVHTDNNYTTTEKNKLSGIATGAEVNAIDTIKVNGTAQAITNKAVDITIPSAVTEATVSGWGFTKNTGTYSKPSDGIPKTDLASAVQTSLGKADTAVQTEDTNVTCYLPNVSIISFVIDNVEGVGTNVQYNALQGMTWQNWIESEYNLNNFRFGHLETINDDKWYIYITTVYGYIYYIDLGSIDENLAKNTLIIANNIYQQKSENSIGGGGN